MKVYILIVAGLLVLPTGCGTERLESERANPLLSPYSGECHKNTESGCLQGEVPAAPELYVQGKKFFDANQLASRFKELLPPVTSQSGALLTADELTFNWISTVDNHNFADGFYVYLKGASARTQKVLKNGRFAVHRLQPGSYEVRVQKELRFKLSDSAAQTIAEEENQDSNQPDAQTTDSSADDLDQDMMSKTTLQKDRIFCSTLYASDFVEIRSGVRTGTLVFDDFSVTFAECGEQADVGTLDLRL